MSPVEENRYDHIDLIRGFALVGVLLINILYAFSTPYVTGELWGKGVHIFPDLPNVFAEWLVSTLFSGKSVALFTMLFAIGLCIQRERILDKGLNWLAYGSRRLAALFVFGALHIWLIWFGDILHAYALVGLVLLPLLPLNRRLLIVLCVVGYAGLMGAALMHLGTALPDHPSRIDPAAIADIQQEIARRVNGYTQTTWLEVMRFRLADWMEFSAFDLVYLPDTLCTAILGVCIWKSGVLRDPGKYRRQILRVTFWALGIGLCLAVSGHLIILVFDLLREHWGIWRWFRLINRAVEPIRAPMLAVGYAGVLLIVSMHPKVSLLLKPLSRFGRMAFTNYIMQSILCVCIFEGWGLGLYGKASPIVVVGQGVAILCFQILFSSLWLGYFRYGPLEWVWRCITYWRVVPLTYRERN